MACRYDDDDERGAQSAKLRDDLDRVTRLLCNVLGTTADHSGFDQEVREWWAEHQAADAARKRREAEEQARRLATARLRIQTAERDLETARRVLEELRKQVG